MNIQESSDTSNISDTSLRRSGDDAVLLNGNGDDYGYDSESSLDFAAIWAAIYRSRFWILGLLLGCLLVGIVVSLLSTAIYQAESKIQIDQEAAKVIGTEQTEAGSSAWDSQRFLQTQLDVVRSRTLAMTVAEDEKLFGNKEFLEAMEVNSDVKAKGVLSQDETERELVIDTLANNLSVSLPDDSRVAAISFQSPDPALAARIANGFAENYIRSNLQRKFDTSSYAREFLKEQLDEAAARLADSEREALNYARRTQIIDTSNAVDGDKASAGSSSLTLATLVQLNQEYAAAFARRLTAEKKWGTARKTAAINSAEVLNNSAVQNLLQEKAKLEAELQDQLQRRKEDFPTVKQLNARVKELDRQVGAISGSIRTSIRGEYETALAQERALQNRINVLKGETLDEQTQSVQLGILQRERDTNRELYDLLLTRYNELNAEAGVQSNNVAIIDRAKTPIIPVSPNIPINLVLSLLAGIGLSGMFVFGREQIFERLRTPDDINRKLGVTSLGTIPNVANESDFIEELMDRKTAVAEAYASVRTSLLMASSHGAPRSLMFTSAQQGEGKSSSCFATALSLSRIGKRIIVVDLDLRRPNQHKFFGLDNGHGMSDVLSQNASLTEVIQKTEYPNIDVIPSGVIPPNPTELLAAESAVQFLRDLEKQYDIVLVDSPPLLGLADAVVIGSFTEACLFVVEANRNPTSTVRSAINRLQQGGAKLTGVLLSKFDPKDSGYSADYAYQYQYRETQSSKK